MNHTRNKVFVINAPTIDGDQVLVDTGAANSPTAFGMISVNTTAGKLAFAFQKANATFNVIPSAAEVQQVVEITFPAIVAGATYQVVREVNPGYMAGRDANYYPNIKKYKYTAPAILGAAGTEKTNAINALVAKINADDSNHATAANKSAGNLILQITEDAGYGLTPSYPGPCSWSMTNAVVAAYTLHTPGTIALGAGPVMLANKAEWTLDKTQLRRGCLEYNFDSDLPGSTKTYTTLIITEKYARKDHFDSDPNISKDIIVYIDEVDANNLNDFLWKLGVDGYRQYTPVG